MQLQISTKGEKKKQKLARRKNFHRTSEGSVASDAENLAKPVLLDTEGGGCPERARVARCKLYWKKAKVGAHAP
eukprot:1152781-Pelagomonas_calceolata.AAC.2